MLQFDDARPLGVGFHIYRMEPGAVSQPHEHTCDEQFLVLDGELIDNDGTVYRTGNLVLLRIGTQHSSTTQTGCTLAVFVEAPEGKPLVQRVGLDADTKAQLTSHFTRVAGQLVNRD